MDEFIERRIVTGLIVSTDYVKLVRPFMDAAHLSSLEMRLIATWAIDYYDKYQETPDNSIEDIFKEECRTGRVDEDQGELIEEILHRLSPEFGRGVKFNSGYLFDLTTKWIREQHLIRNEERVAEAVSEGNVEEAERLKTEFKPLPVGVSRGLELGSDESMVAVEQAFKDDSQRVLRYPGAIGRMMNPHLIRGGFVAFLGPEKRGKSFMLMDFAIRAVRQKSNVALFEAGDMTQSQQLRRICIYMSHLSDRETNAYYRPVGDCILNQLDLCDRDDRNCDHGVMDITEEEYYSNREERESFGSLVKLAQDNTDYRPCDSHLCDEQKLRRPTVWLEQRPRANRLDGRNAQRHMTKFFERYRRRFKLVDYPSGTLTLAEMRGCLDEWQQKDDFTADVIVVDYADLLHDPTQEFRHQINQIWKGLRGMSQERHALVVTATQADAGSYKAHRVGLQNFSEDKRKYAHVTAMWGLNQDPKGREKRLGLMRINELVVREGQYSVDSEVTVLQDLRIAHAVRESYR